MEFDQSNLIGTISFTLSKLIASIKLTLIEYQNNKRIAGIWESAVDLHTSTHIHANNNIAEISNSKIYSSLDVVGKRIEWKQFENTKVNVKWSV